MKKIIKSGRTSFTTRCEKCLCKFEYELRDIEDSNEVICPECGNANLHNPYFYDLDTPQLRGTNNCEGCPNLPTLAKGEFYIGDTVCDFCTKNPYRATCLGSGIASSCGCSARYDIDCECETDCSSFLESYTTTPASSNYYTCTAEGVNYDTVIDTTIGTDISNFDVALEDTTYTVFIKDR